VQYAKTNLGRLAARVAVAEMANRGSLGSQILEGERSGEVWRFVFAERERHRSSVEKAMLGDLGIDRIAPTNIDPEAISLEQSQETL
jgi:hypothetical protein